MSGFLVCLKYMAINTKGDKLPNLITGRLYIFKGGVYIVIVGLSL